jgi:hypothetical protein
LAPNPISNPNQLASSQATSTVAEGGRSVQTEADSMVVEDEDGAYDDLEGGLGEGGGRGMDIDEGEGEGEGEEEGEGEGDADEEI